MQDSDEVFDGRVIGQPAFMPYVGDGAAYDRVVALVADPGAETRPGVVVERPEHGGCPLVVPSMSRTMHAAVTSTGFESDVLMSPLG